MKLVLYVCDVYVMGVYAYVYEGSGVYTPMFTGCNVRCIAYCMWWSKKFEKYWQLIF